MNDFALSNKNALGLGTSIDQSRYDDDTNLNPYNLYLTVTPLDNNSESATKVKWLTRYKTKDVGFYGATLTKINDNRFLVMWEEGIYNKEVDYSKSRLWCNVHRRRRSHNNQYICWIPLSVFDQPY